MFDLLPSERNIGEDMAKIFKEMQADREIDDYKEFKRMMKESDLVKKTKWTFEFVPKDIRFGFYFSPMGIEINLPMICIFRDSWWTNKA